MLNRIHLAAAVALTIGLAGCQSTSSSGTSTNGSAWHQYGATMTLGEETIALGALEGGESDVTVRGTITSVCAEKGCWMRVADESGQEIMVRFKDYSFFVPRNAAGRTVVLHGQAESLLVPVDELQHYAEDAGKSPAEIAAITEPEESILLMADSVTIEGDGLDDPHTQ